ncbi:Rid family hydrolase [Streptomyces sp. NPDC006527]|uniref:Rid family hydrolase n=1 Tax=Streptomyces sp. NPDC006527 TaxID=3364749 RepID=UPI003683E5D7
MNRRTRTLTAAAVGATLVLTGATMADAQGRLLGGREVRVMLPQGQSNPAIATGVATGKDLAFYQSSGLGPTALNPSAPADSPERYTDPSMTGGAEGVTVTEAQALVVLRNIAANLKAAGVEPKDVITMKCYLAKPPGAAVADYAGWNRAYRQFFANVDLETRQAVPVPMGSSAPKPPITANAARPARATMEVTSLAVPGWLVEVEVTATYPRR